MNGYLSNYMVCKIGLTMPIMLLFDNLNLLDPRLNLFKVVVVIEKDLGKHLKKYCSLLLLYLKMC
jgi:hypothetical protein